MKIFVQNSGEYEAIIKEVLTETEAVWGEGDITVTLDKCNEGVRVVSDGRNVTLYYSDLTSLFRGIGTVVSREGPYDITEKLRYRQLGNMVDCSRNAVAKVETVKRFCRISALMGFNMLQLYTEDTYEIEGEPYFGHLRGRYTGDELREIDEYAAKFGIEVIPCIQTLAHLNAIFQWRQYQKYMDSMPILNVGLEETYSLIEKMLITMKNNLRSRKINIGMDEAHNLGRGKYMDMFGYKNRADIMKEHLKKVAELCEKHGYEPMMWSDMFFRACSKNSDYYDKSIVISDEILNSVPDNVSLVMWCYYYEEELYDIMCREHFRFKNKIHFAGGAACWGGFSPFQIYAKNITIDTVNKIKDYPFDIVFCTEWGDGGAETSFFTTLPTMAIYAESSWNGNTDDETLRECLKRVSANYDDFMQLDDFSVLPSVKPKDFSYITRYLLYGDILQGKWDKQVPDESDVHFIETSKRMAEASKRNPKWNVIFDFYEQYAKVLSVKSKLGIRLKAAYDSNDIEAMNDIASKVIPSLVNETEILLKAFKKRWEAYNKDFGFDVQEIRIGGLIYRLKGASDKINDYLEGKTKKIEELEQPRLLVAPTHPEGAYGYYTHWKDSVTSSLL